MPDPETPAPEDFRRTSTLLRELVLENTAEYITLGNVLDQLGDRAFGFMIFLLAFPNCLPVPPGFSTVTGLLILPIALQFFWQRERLHLPQAIRNRPISRAVLARAVKVILPGLTAMEKLFRPRWQFLCRGWGERIVGLMILMLTCLLLTPLPPPMHFLPASGLGLIALGVMERDGLVITGGMLVGLGGMVSLALLGEIVVKMLARFAHHFRP